MPSLELAYGISVLVLPAEGVSWDCNIGMQEPMQGIGLECKAKCE